MAPSGPKSIPLFMWLPTDRGKPVTTSVRTIVAALEPDSFEIAPVKSSQATPVAERSQPNWPLETHSTRLDDVDAGSNFIPEITRWNLNAVISMGAPALLPLESRG